MEPALVSVPELHIMPYIALSSYTSWFLVVETETGGLSLTPSAQKERGSYREIFYLNTQICNLTLHFFMVYFRNVILAGSLPGIWMDDGDIFLNHEMVAELVPLLVALVPHSLKFSC